MKVLLIGTAAILAGCTGSGVKDESQPLARACSVSECFFERDVRDFEVIDKTTVIVYVGTQHCPFQVDLRGFACDMTFAPTIAFRTPDNVDNRTQNDEANVGRPRDPFSTAPISGSDVGQNRARDLRVCSNDLRIGVDGGVFTEGTRSSSQTTTDRFDNMRSLCQIDKIVSLTDDQLIELLVERKGFAPPPPMGGGEIQVSKEQEEGATSPSEPPAPEPAAPL